MSFIHISKPNYQKNGRILNTLEYNIYKNNSFYLINDKLIFEFNDPCDTITILNTKMKRIAKIGINKISIKFTKLLWREGALHIGIALRNLNIYIKYV